jgi:transposase
MSGLSAGQLDELVTRVSELLGMPWHKERGRRRGLSLREAVIVACGYMRSNITEEIWAAVFSVSQPTISRAITTLTPLIAEATAGCRPGEEQAAAAVAGQTVLLDGFLAPCWSWQPVHLTYSGKHRTTGFNAQVITTMNGHVLYISGPLPGRTHDMAALSMTPAKTILASAFSVLADKGYQGSGYITPHKKKPKQELAVWQKQYNSDLSRLRSPIERAIAHIKSWRILHTDYRRPLSTYYTSFQAAIGLYFYKLTYE